MAKRKKSRKGLRKKKSNKLPLFLIFIPIFIGVLLLHLYLSRAVTRVSIPPYEEISARSDRLADKIRQLDRVLFESFYSGGVNEEDIFFSEIITMYEGEHAWDFTEIQVLLPDDASAENLAEIISRQVFMLKPAVTLKKEVQSQDRVIFHTYINGLNAHRIKLLFDNNIGLERDLSILPKLAIIIDDIGYDREMAIAFMDLGLPVVLSILPRAPRSVDIAKIAGERGHELMLHLPMEPNDYPDVNPGDGALLNDMDEEMIRSLVYEHINSIPGVKGVNNHMGSSFTERHDKMKYVLEEIKKQGLFFVDSRTTKRTIAYELAKSMGVPAAKKNIFLDNDIAPEAVRFEMDHLLRIARSSGRAVGIGHPHRETLKVLREYAGLLKSEYNVVPVSKLLD